MDELISWASGGGVAAVLALAIGVLLRTTNQVRKGELIPASWVTQQMTILRNQAEVISADQRAQIVEWREAYHTERERADMMARALTGVVEPAKTGAQVMSAVRSLAQARAERAAADATLELPRIPAAATMEVQPVPLRAVGRAQWDG